MNEQTGAMWRPFLVRILLPSFLAVALFVAFIFGVIIPDVEGNLLERKREMIRELTHSAWSVLKEVEDEVKAGTLAPEAARRTAAERVRNLRYGPENKDYFWITDSRPVMVMHPFRSDLEGHDVSEFRDPVGNAVFVEFVNVVRDRGAGYVDYVWQWKDDPSRLVPKESFVMGFEPWGWVIGTGIYTEDVREEIAALTGRLIRYSLVIAAIVALILLFVVQQSLRLERRRAAAEDALRASHERHRALVEAATDGTVLVLDGRCTFANPTFLGMIGCAPADLETLALDDVLASGTSDSAATGPYLNAIVAGQPAPAQISARVRRRDGRELDVLLSATRVTMDGRDGLILNVKDVARSKRVEDELGYSRERFRALRAAIDFGVFRVTAGRNPRLIEANPAARRIFGLGETEDVAGFDLLATCLDAEDREGLVRALATDAVVKDRVVPVRRRDGSSVTVSLSAVVVEDEQGRPRWCDGFVEDLTERRRVESEREALVSELQTSLMFLNEPIRRYLQQGTPVCDLATQIDQAAGLMTRSGRGALLVTTEAREPIGVVTDRDLRERVVAAGLDGRTPVFRVMSSPLVTVSDQALVYEALALMREKAIQYLAVREGSGRIAGLVRQSDLSQFHRYSSAVLVQEIRRADTIEALKECHGRLPTIVRTLIDSGARPRNVNRVVTTVSDAIGERLLALAISALGPPPARFAFITLGSEGREEQTLVTDQDNALVWEDVPPDEAAAAVEYFGRLGTRVCDALAEIGYALCPGEIMAKNPKWCRPLSGWKEHFSSWIRASNPQDLLSINIFFDFRCLAGERSLAGEIRRHIRAELDVNPGFFHLFAQNALLYKAPVGIFGNIVAESDGRGSARTFSIKDAMTPVVNFARLYALKHGVAETNTFDRLRALHEKNVLRKGTHDEVVESYAFLMQTRLRHQAGALAEGAAPSNAINPKSLSHLEEAALKKTFGHIVVLQKKIGFDFLGSA